MNSSRSGISSLGTDAEDIVKLSLLIISIKGPSDAASIDFTARMPNSSAGKIGRYSGEGSLLDSHNKYCAKLGHYLTQWLRR